MPITCSRLSLPTSTSSGASSWQGTHHGAQTLTTLTLPLKTAGSSPGTGAPPANRPASGGNAVCGAGWPIKAEGIREGSPPPSRNQNSVASAANAINGVAISQDLVEEGGGGGVPVVGGSLILIPPRFARSASPHRTRRVRAVASSGGDSRSRSRQ